MTERPRFIENQMRPWGSAATERNRPGLPSMPWRPSARPYSRTSLSRRDPARSAPRAMRRTWCAVATHRKPAWSAAMPRIGPRRESGPPLATRKRPDWKDARPSEPPIQRTPVESSARQWMVSPGKPSRAMKDCHRSPENLRNPSGVANHIIPVSRFQDGRNRVGRQAAGGVQRGEPAVLKSADSAGEHAGQTVPSRF